MTVTPAPSAWHRYRKAENSLDPAFSLPVEHEAAMGGGGVGVAPELLQRRLLRQCAAAGLLVEHVDGAAGLLGAPGSIALHPGRVRQGDLLRWPLGEVLRVDQHERAG